MMAWGPIGHPMTGDRRALPVRLRWNCLRGYMKFKIAIVALVGLASVGLYDSRLPAQEGGRSVWDGVYTKEQADRGKGLYAQDCGSCHGDQLTGGEMAPALAGGDFLSNWNGLTVGAFFDRIRTSMPLNKP